MDQEFKVLGYQLACNQQIELHSLSQLSELAQRKVIDNSILDYNQKLRQFLSSQQLEVDEKERKDKLKGMRRLLSKIDRLNEQQKICILNNRFQNENELLLKIQGTALLSAKEKKTILQSHLAKTV